MRIETLEGHSKEGRWARPGGIWIDCLWELYGAECRLAAELPRLFSRTRWLPLRLVLADQRRETVRHLHRLECLIPTLDEPTGGRLGTTVRDDESFASIPAAAIVAGPLRAARATVISYRSAVATANERGLTYAADLLTRSRTEEEATVRRLTEVASEIERQ